MAWGEVTGHPEGRGRSLPTAVRGRLLLTLVVFICQMCLPLAGFVTFSKMCFFLLSLNVVCSGQPKFYFSIF